MHMLWIPLLTAWTWERFIDGCHDTIYDKLGAHPMTRDGAEGTYFAVWAPNARAVSVVGDFNQWRGRCPSHDQEGTGRDL